MIIARTARFTVLGLLVAACLGGTISCERSALLAPTGSSITLTSSINALPVNGTTDIIAQVLESGGTPPHSGTMVSFTTTLGFVQPADAETDTNGRVIVRFHAGPANGTATINAYSGGSTTATGTGSTTGGTTTPTSGAVKISIGTAAVGRVVINANPAQVPNTGGTTAIVATVFDVNGNGLSGAPVSFTTTSGTLGSSLVLANVDGVAATTLTTNLAATVTASVGATATTPPAGGGTTPAPSGSTSASVTIAITAAPTIAITPPATAPSVGLPASFTFVVTVPATNGSAVKDVRVNWGDGDSVSLGAITGSQSATHVYSREGSFTVTATVTDVNGVSNSASTVVTLIPVASPTIIITPSVPTTGGGATAPTSVSFTIQVTPPAGVNITSARIDFGDGEFQTLGGLTGTTTLSHQYQPGNKGPRTVTVTVVDSLGRTTSGQTSINVPT